MLPLEFTATPEPSPKCISGGSWKKFGTEPNCSSGAEVDWAKADGLKSTSNPVSHFFMVYTSLVTGRDGLMGNKRAECCPAVRGVYREAARQHNRVAEG